MFTLRRLFLLQFLLCCLLANVEGFWHKPSNAFPGAGITTRYAWPAKHIGIHWRSNKRVYALVGCHSIQGTSVDRWGLWVFIDRGRLLPYGFMYYHYEMNPKRRQYWSMDSFWSDLYEELFGKSDALIETGK